jgi:anti-sigma regulatory factor (Ser/Thr protein kinase)
LTGESNGDLPPQPGLKRTLPARPGSPAEARRAVAALALPEETRQNLELVVSELVTNSVRHAGNSAHDPTGIDDAIDLQLTHTDGEVQVTVRDRGPGFSMPNGSRGPPLEGGLGLVVVEVLSKAWGVHRDNAGCTVWSVLEVQEST